jgi:hypothetical protein
VTPHRHASPAALFPVVLSLAAVLLAPAPAHAKGPTPKEQKINAYVQIINGESNHVFETRKNYAAWVASMKTGPTCKETKLRGPGSVGDSAPERWKKYRAALAKKPKLEADQAALEMVDALEALYKPQNEASEYYYKNLHTKDACKKGQELHPLLVAGWTKFAQADRLVRDFVEKHQDETDVTELAGIEKKYGKRLRYFHRKLLLDGKFLVREADAQTKQATPDVAAIRGKLTPFVQSLDEAKALVATEKKGKNSEALYQGGYEQLLTRAGWYKDAVNELLRQLENPTKEKQNAVDERRKRAVEQVIKSYNGMIEQSNGVGYTKNMK